MKNTSVSLSLYIHIYKFRVYIYIFLLYICIYIYIYCIIYHPYENPINIYIYMGVQELRWPRVFGKCSGIVMLITLITNMNHISIFVTRVHFFNWPGLKIEDWRGFRRSWPDSSIHESVSQWGPQLQQFNQSSKNSTALDWRLKIEDVSGGLGQILQSTSQYSWIEESGQDLQTHDWEWLVARFWTLFILCRNKYFLCLKTNNAHVVSTLFPSCFYILVAMLSTHYLRWFKHMIC